jgi:hypothetical protein
VRSASPLVATAVAALAACGVSATVEPCPGEPQARLVLRATADGDAACAVAAGFPAPGAVTAVLAFTADGGAALCPDRPLAEPLRGTRAGDAIAVASPPRAAAAPACACAAVVVERVAGTLVRSAAGAAIGFTGELVNELAPADGAASCAPPGAAPCPLPCSARWRVDGAP